MTLDEIKKDMDLLNEIDWDMTPEEAVLLYLEWGNNWAHGKVVKSKNDFSLYFSIDNWGNTPVVYLNKINSEESSKIASFELSGNIKNFFMESTSGNKGVYAIDGEVKNWLRNKIMN